MASSGEVKTVDVVVDEKSLDPRVSMNPEHHHPTGEDVKAKAFYELEKHKNEHQTLIAKQLERADTFQVGMRFLHDIHGPGEVVEILEDGRRRIQFDNGASHAYKPSSIHKLKPIVDDAHTFTPAMLFKMVDTDNSGSLNLDEFKILHDIIVKDEQARAQNISKLTEQSEKAKQEITRLRKVVLAAFIFCCAFLGCIAGMTVAVVKGFKDTEAQTSSGAVYFADVHGNVMEMTPAVVALPMLAAPVLPTAQLHSIHKLTVSVYDPRTSSPSRNRVVEVVENVVSIESINDVCIAFKMAGGTVTSVHVCNGESYAMLTPMNPPDEQEVEGPVRTPVCFADVECSALRVNDAADADKLIGEACDALEAKGFDSTGCRTTRRRMSEAGVTNTRRLAAGGTCHMCPEAPRTDAKAGNMAGNMGYATSNGRRLASTQTTMMAAAEHQVVRARQLQSTAGGGQGQQQQQNWVGGSPTPSPYPGMMTTTDAGCVPVVAADVAPSPGRFKADGQPQWRHVVAGEVAPSAGVFCAEDWVSGSLTPSPSPGMPCEVQVNHAYDKPGYYTCGCVPRNDPCLRDGVCHEEPSCPAKDGETIPTVSSDVEVKGPGGSPPPTYWPEEITWTLRCGGVEISGGAPYPKQIHYMPDVLCTLEMHDSYGDGWNGGVWEGFGGSASLESGGHRRIQFIPNQWPPSPPSPSPPPPPYWEDEFHVHPPASPRYCDDYGNCWGGQIPDDHHTGTGNDYDPNTCQVDGKAVCCWALHEWGDVHHLHDHSNDGYLTDGFQGRVMRNLQDTHGLSKESLEVMYSTVRRPRYSALQKELAKADLTDMQTVDLVVARYNEDASWLADVERELPTVRIFVYEKGASQTACHKLHLKRATCVPLANVGREAHAYLTHLIEHHDQLADKVVFAQAGPPGYGFLAGHEGGHLMPGSDFFYDYLSPLTEPRMVFTMAYANLPDREVLIRRDGYPMNEPMEGRYALVTDEPTLCASDWLTINNSTLRFWDALHARNPEFDLPNQIEYWRAHLESELGPITDAFMPFANGAIASASGARLAARPKAFYERLRRTVSTGDTPDAIFFLELSWAYVIGHTEAAHACSRQIAAHVETGTAAMVEAF